MQSSKSDGSIGVGFAAGLYPALAYPEWPLATLKPIFRFCKKPPSPQKVRMNGSKNAVGVTKRQLRVWPADPLQQ